MMVEPGMDVLLEKVDSKYTLVSVSAKRAREIMKKDGTDTDNPVSVALRQIAEGRVLWQREGELPFGEEAFEEEAPEEEALEESSEGEAPEEAACEEVSEETAAETPEEEEAAEEENE